MLVGLGEGLSTIASGQCEPTDLALDNERVTWSNRGSGQICKKVKPP